MGDDNESGADGDPQPGRYNLGKASGFVGALWLIVWFVVCLAGILATMAAQDFQKRLVGATDNTKYSVGYALDQVDVLARRRDAVQKAGDALTDAEAIDGKAHAVFLQAINATAGTRTFLTSVFGKLSAKLLPPDQAFPGLGDGQTVDNFVASLGAARGLMQRLEVAYGAPTSAAQEELKAQMQNARDATDLFATGVQDLQTKSALWGSASLAVADRKTDVTNAGKNLVSPPFDNHDFEQLADDLSRYRELLGGWPYTFVALPGIALTLLLTVLMGILGSLIAVTRALVFDDDHITIGEYLFRIGLGASVALAIFFFVGVGVLTLAQSTASAHGVEPSPYLVSFFGIVAGYLSRRVTSWMREAGGRAFPVGDDADRWAIDLGTALKTANTDAAGLAKATHLDGTRIAAWIERTEAIPISAQGLIAAYVRQPAYTLFSDIRPTR